MVQSWLRNTSELKFNTYCLIAAFGVYFCMYAFRKPFTAASFEHKEILVIAQVIGYMFSKFFGIKFVSELKGQNRAYIALYLILFAEMALIAFAYIPEFLRPFDYVLLFLNGLPLGIIWGIVFSYIEGRRFTEILASGLTVSFIISSGFVKSAGKMIGSTSGVSLYEMPYFTGLVFLPFFVLFVWMLAQIPPPNKEDVAQRTVRVPMMKEQRMAFFRSFAPGIIVLIISYMLFTAYRDIRENFANEIWKDLGITNAEIFTQTELPVGLIIGVILAMCFRIKDNIAAFRFYHLLILLGLLVILFSSAAYTSGLMGPLSWMVLVGVGAYMAYVTYASVMFDRLVGAYTQGSGNAGFMIYVVDSMGYLGSVLIMLYKYFGQPSINWVKFFLNGSFVVAFAGIVLVLMSLAYFSQKLNVSKKVVLINENV